MLQDSNLRVVPEFQPIFNRQFREQWDEIRDFLALHYKFNRKLDTPFWQACREQISLGGIQSMVDLFQREGPVRVCREFVPSNSVFEFEGYLMMMICQRLPTSYRNEFMDVDLLEWRNYQRRVRANVSQAFSVRDGLKIVSSPDFRWPGEGGA